MVAVWFPSRVLAESRRFQQVRFRLWLWLMVPGGSLVVLAVERCSLACPSCLPVGSGYFPAAHGTFPAGLLESGVLVLVCFSGSGLKFYSTVHNSILAHMVPCSAAVLLCLSALPKFNRASAPMFHRARANVPSHMRKVRPQMRQCSTTCSQNLSRIVLGCAVTLRHRNWNHAGSKPPSVMFSMFLRLYTCACPLPWSFSFLSCAECWHRLGPWPSCPCA